jgi:iron transport multicopper oxidase
MLFQMGSTQTSPAGSYTTTQHRNPPHNVQEFEPFDDFDLVPFDKEALLDHVDQSITLNMKMDNLADGAN